MAISDILGKLEASLQNMLSLEIVTAVGGVRPSTRDAQGIKQQISVDPGAKILRTRIDLLQGDLSTEMDPAFVTGDYTDLRAFHAEREKQALDIVKANVEAVKALISLIQNHGDKPPAGGQR